MANKKLTSVCQAGSVSYSPMSLYGNKKKSPEVQTAVSYIYVS